MPTSQLLSDTIAAIHGLDPQAVAAARDHQDRLTKPRGSLGALEDLSVQLAGLAGQAPAPIPAPAAVAVFVGDHGVHAQGVTAWPQEVTGQMVANFLAGGAVINVLARQAGASVAVIDVGMSEDAAAVVTDLPGLLRRNVRRATADLSVTAAMSADEALSAIEVGIGVANELIAAGNRCMITGDMGIANTTASAALVARFTGSPADTVTGFGTGISDEMHAHKVEIVERALARQGSDASDPLGVLADLGGLEHAAIAGFLLGAAAARVPVILDGVIACSAALVAQALAPDVVAALIAGHRSVEPAANLALRRLGLVPVLTLDMRLGEGSGAALALPIVQSAAAVLAEVATFDSAGVTDKHDE
ncbi:nicotinate-nucleotide-dimethylbenzimidazole phosphoribosyltransferase [Frankineae bacterium MT45]|nr:nicotinate-nucleotide-dimethylbenzimidazole phosphoribosyltransferase [Frankineae bacterium MT45]